MIDKLNKLHKALPLGFTLEVQPSEELVLINKGKDEVAQFNFYSIENNTDWVLSIIKDLCAKHK